MGSNPYFLLKMKMDEVEKSKPNNIQTGSVKSNLNSSTSKSSSSTSKSSVSSTSTSSAISDKSVPKQKEFPSSAKNQDPNIPDHSFGDFHCIVCDSHMNSQGMWEAHIIGKRHQKNLKKSDPDTRYEDLDVDSNLNYDLRNVKDVIVGLSYIHEIRRKEIDAPPLFKCFLCHAAFANTAMVIEHVISLKHRLNYIKENSPKRYALLDGTSLKKGQRESLVEELASDLQKEFGSGTVKVKQEKTKPAYSPLKRSIDSEEDDDDVDEYVNKKPKIQKQNKKSPYVWKPFVLKKDNWKNIKDCRDIIEQKRRKFCASDEEVDIHVQRDPVQRSVYYNDSKSYKKSSYSQESSKLKRTHSRSPDRFSSEDDYNSYSRSPSREPVKKKVFHSRNADDSPPHKLSRPRSPQKEYKEYVSSKDYSSPIEVKKEQPDSVSTILQDFVRKVYALPTELFFKTVLMKLNSIEIKGIEELNQLSKVITKAQSVFCNNLPSDVEAVLRQKMFRSVENSPKAATLPGTNQVVESSVKSDVPSGPDLSFVRSIMNQIQGKNPVSSVSSNAASDQKAASYSGFIHGNNSSYQNSYMSPNESYSHNSPSSSMTSHNSASSSMTSGIPGLTLTEDVRQSYPSYNTSQSQFTYQSEYSGSSSLNYSQYKF